MKKFIVINGTEATVIKADSLLDAIEKAIAICNHSKEIIVREITNIESLLTHAAIIA